MSPDEYQQAIGELARRSAMPDAVAATMEKDLERAFESLLPEARRSARPRFPSRLLASAAAVVLAVGAMFWYARTAVEQLRLNAGISDGKAGPKASAIEKADVKASSTGKADVEASATGKVGLKGSTTGRRKVLPPVIQPGGFVAVPAAAKLPQFESGLIVRMALPVTALPSYGVDIFPASSGEPVEADVLVGQDGLARAIRLVNTSRSQQ